MALGESTPSAGGVLVKPQYGTDEKAGVEHVHAVAGGGRKKHKHPDVEDGHAHEGLLPYMQDKSFFADFEIKAVNEKTDGTLYLSGYANTWDLDRDGEITAKTAFDDTLQEYLTNPILLWSHKANHEIGYITTAQTDSKGLRVEAVVPPPIAGSPPWHVKVYNDIKNRVLRTFSMGGKFFRSPSIKGLIEKVRLLEVSVVGVPANPTSLFSVAESKGLTFDEKAAPAMPGVGREHGRHRSGGRRPRKRRTRATHTHKNGKTHSHISGTKPHHHGVHAHNAKGGGGHKTHAHGIAVAGHSHATAGPMVPPGKDFDEWEWKENVDEEGTNPTEDSDGTIIELLEGLCDAIEEIASSDQSDTDKVDNVESLLQDFTEEASSRLADNGEEQPEDEEPKQFVRSLADTKAVHLRGRIDEILALEPHKQEIKNMGDENEGKAGTVTVDAKSFDEMQKALAVLADEKASRDMQAKADAEAQKRIEDEKQAAEAKAAKDAEDQKRFNVMVEQALDKYRQTQTSGKKFQFPTTPGHDGTATDVPQYKSFSSWLRDLRDAKKGNFHAYERLEKMQTHAAEFYSTDPETGQVDTKALNEAATTGGGFLVPPQYWQAGIAEFRIAAAKIRQLVTVLNVNSNLVYIPRGTGVSAVGWTSENAAKPATDQTFGQIAVNVFTLAGISKVSNQLLEDSSPAVDQIVRKDLGRVIGQAEDIAFINGSGAGQPTGIIGTTGVLTVAYSQPATGSGLGDAISAAITAIDSNFFALPTAVLMHPRIIQKLRQAKDTTGRYIFEPGYYPGLSPNAGGMPSFVAGGAGASPSYGASNPNSPDGPVGSVWGLPVFSDANIPTNLGGGTNESPAIVAAWNEAYLLERLGVQLDVSNEAGTSFEQNQTWFRAETRLGFTAARQPTAFCVITGLTAAIAG